MLRIAETTSSLLSTLIQFPVCSLDGIWLPDIKTWGLDPLSRLPTNSPCTSARVSWVESTGWLPPPRSRHLLNSQPIQVITQVCDHTHPSLLRTLGRDSKCQQDGHFRVVRLSPFVLFCVVSMDFALSFHETQNALNSRQLRLPLRCLGVGAGGRAGWYNTARTGKHHVV